MKLSDLEATNIITTYLGERGALKSDEELAKILKSRLTKKEREVINCLVTQGDKEALIAKLNIDGERFDTIATTVIKKLKNETLHREFYILSTQTSTH